MIRDEFLGCPIAIHRIKLEQGKKKTVAVLE
jgi:hypothetical protein